jgi:hypothetical protein
MKTIIFISLAFLLSCKKEAENPDAKFALNQFSATVYFSKGDSVKISVKGKDAHIGCQSYGGAYVGPTYACGVNDFHQEVYASVFSECVLNSGSYPISCIYYPDMRSASIPTYQNDFTSKDSITITKVDALYYEGYFNAVCKNYVTQDSVIVKGFFSGIREN